MNALMATGGLNGVRFQSARSGGEFKIGQLEQIGGTGAGAARHPGRCFRPLTSGLVRVAFALCSPNRFPSGWDTHLSTRVLRVRAASLLLPTFFCTPRRIRLRRPHSFRPTRCITHPSHSLYIATTPPPPTTIPRACHPPQQQPKPPPETTPCGGRREPPRRARHIVFVLAPRPRSSSSLGETRHSQGRDIVVVDSSRDHTSNQEDEITDLIP